jgi:hypothetical protein
MKEIILLSQLTGITSLQKVNIVITHTKPPQSRINRIKQQLKKVID